MDTNIGSDFLDVRDANSRISPQRRISNNSLDADVRMEGLTALQSWDCVLETFPHPDAEGNLAHPSGKRHALILLMISLAMRLTTFQATLQSSFPAKLCILEDNEAVIRMIIKKVAVVFLRHVSRTHRVDLDWLF